MNRRQHYNTSTPEERIEHLIDAILKLDQKKHKRILHRGRLIRERRDPSRSWHFIGDRRNPELRRRKAIYLTWFAVILGVVSTAMWLIAIHSPFDIAIRLIIVYELLLASLLLSKPYLRFRPAIN